MGTPGCFRSDADADGVIDGPPQASVNNFTAGQRTANFATVKADRQGRICVYSSSATDLLWDQVLETAAPAAHTPVRYYDSRLPAGSAIANNAGQRIDPNDGSKVVRIHTGIPGGAVIGNVTVTDPQTDGRTAVFACNDLAAAATTSASNFVSGQTLGNGAFWRADPNGDVCIRTTALAHPHLGSGGRDHHARRSAGSGGPKDGLAAGTHASAAGLLTPASPPHCRREPGTTEALHSVG